MKMGAVGASSMLMNFYKMLHCYIPKDSAVCSDCHKNLESHSGCCSDDSLHTFDTMRDCKAIPMIWMYVVLQSSE